MTNKPALGILMRALAMGGAEKQSLLQAKLMSADFDVYYIVQKKKFQLKRYVDFIEHENINYIQLHGNIFSRAIQLIKLIRSKKIKILFSYLPLDNLLASVVSIFIRIKYAGGIRNSRLPFIKFHANWILQKFFLDYLIFNNYAGRDFFIKKGYSASKAVVIQNCIDKILKEISRPVKDSVKIISVGRFTAQKDYLTSLRAISLLQKKVPERLIEYFIIGKGELEEQIKSWIKELNLPNVNVVRNPDNITDYYLDADIYLMSSVFEGTPNSVMEALNYSLPVVSTDVGDLEFLVKKNMTGYLVPVRDHVLLADRLAELVQDSEKRNIFGLNGHNLLEKEFSEKKYSERYINFTKEVLGIN